MTKPRPVSQQFGPFMVSNRKWGKIVPPYFSTGFHQYPVADADITVELGDTQQRMTATRILAGGALLGPAGMILGGMAKKDITRGKITLSVAGEHVQTFEFKGADIDRALAFVDALATAQAQ